MAHGKVWRRSMSLEEWAWLELSRIDELVVAESIATSGWEVREGQYFPEGYQWENDFHPIAEGDYWGMPDGAVQFKAKVTIPAELAGMKVWFWMRTGAEVIVTCDGAIRDGIDPNRPRFLLSEEAKPGESFELLLDAYTRSKPDDTRNPDTKAIRGCVQHFATPRLVVVNEDALSLKYDLETFLQVAYCGNAPEDARAYMTHHVRDLVKCFPESHAPVEELVEAMPRIREYLKTHIYRDDHPYGHVGKLACVAHSHLDIGYLWKVAQTVQKNARTCIIQLRMMDRYPEFTYAHSQAWCYETLEKCYPEVFAEIVQRVKEGRWEIVGGQYVEPDGNLPSAESHVRQVLYGKRYFLEKFGVEIDSCWLPDNFGNSAVMPQILKLGGIDYFVSNKMSTWNDTNRFPHHVFLWRGLDGTDVRACIPPMHFISWNDPAQMYQSWSAFQNKQICSESIHMYGYGDGGSGVTEDMVEAYYRLAKTPGFPTVRLTTARDYLHTAFAQAEGQLPVWDDELYLEMHRGTFTTKGDLKRENRECEFLAYETETLCALAMVEGASYPAEKLREAWKKILVNQFHDIIPGSHTEPVFREAVETYRQIRRTLEECRAAALDTVAPGGLGDEVCVFNSFSNERGGLVTLPCGDLAGEAWELADGTGGGFPLQPQVVPHAGERFVAEVGHVPPMASVTFSLRAGEAGEPSDEFVVSPTTLENRFHRLTFDSAGRLVSILDKNKERELVPEGSVANEWQVYQDRPGQFNAWDLHERYPDHPIPIGEWDRVEVAEQGPVSAAVRLTRSFSKSRAEQVIRIYANVPRIDFETWTDWHEEERVLKVAFPVTVRARSFTTDTTAGVLERDNHANTSWQKGKFEVCCHKWVDLSEGLFGVSLLNNCKYGCDVKGNVMRLTLLRSPIAPDPVSDRGEHRFTYSLFSHGGDWRRDGLVETAFDLNWPLVGMRGHRGGERDGEPWITVSSPALRVMALKGDEDGAGDVIIRFSELYGSHGTAGISTAFDFAMVRICDLLERPGAAVASSANSFNLTYRPYQILTVRLTRR